ncbi:hypothetical protein L1987_63272 [Smallanthus sonchifolius]|uniref:Uncharacterized protein n=1 Tax=Smallanthus sonchifolius TaxID=185202 RepID=A0ACB9CCW2_9ASTR|nr:hypothetical protein L1987_63272 [Smallanthus sonchifolius]
MYFCENNANYTVNSTYERNLDTTLSALPTTTNGFGFYNLSTGLGNDRVNSAALCRGDINPVLCRSCLNESIVTLRQRCPNQKQAVIYYDYCLLKYSNETVLGITGFKFSVYLANPENTTDVDRFYGALRPLLSRLRGDAAAGGSLQKFASGNTSVMGLPMIHALVQCTPDLLEQQCSECLMDAMGYITQLLDRKVGGRILLQMCNFRYESYGFFNLSTLNNQEASLHNQVGLMPEKALAVRRGRRVADAGEGVEHDRHSFVIFVKRSQLMREKKGREKRAGNEGKYLGK